MPADKDTQTQKIEATLREHAMSHAGAHEDFPWGHRAIKVKDKTFLFMSVDGAKLSLSVKLPESGGAALMLPFTQPTDYGLGKSGWVTARFDAGAQAPVSVLKAWIDESYQAIAPKKLSAKAGRGSPPSRATRVKAAAKKAVASVKKVAKKAVAKVRGATKKASPPKKVSAPKRPARKATPARGKRQAAPTTRRARRS
ncbi:MmcQ/YjbR family DNA-binding protein [Myxococcaceae bacterium JPH2]|nr:MmcQ/YjbR family DNA-binding protein [Myxococcaceae bacterium JPH2]